jgi:hypothetical protein
VADYVEKNQPLPRELQLAFRCNQWNTLPNPGGLLDQPAGLIEKMTVSLNYYNALTAWKNRDKTKDSEFVKQHPYDWAMVQHVMELRSHG